MLQLFKGAAEWPSSVGDDNRNAAVKFVELRLPSRVFVGAGDVFRGGNRVNRRKEGDEFIAAAEDHTPSALVFDFLDRILEGLPSEGLTKSLCAVAPIALKRPFQERPEMIGIGPQQRYGRCSAEANPFAFVLSQRLAQRPVRITKSLLRLSFLFLARLAVAYQAIGFLGLSLGVAQPIAVESEKRLRDAFQFAGEVLQQLLVTGKPVPALRHLVLPRELCDSLVELPNGFVNI